MEVREFAERILCATTLEEKLIDPPAGRLTDERPGPAWDREVEPGRPAELRFKAAGSGRPGGEAARRASAAGFPGLHGLGDEAGRGRVLHFFANHELLATELMALVLLRFPDAPPAFRRGVVHTLREEQEHVRLYLDRMKACGIAFGSLPVSGYFWRSVAPMRHPMDFVTGLSLTFEQANLDFARVFSRAFAEAGDPETAALLRRILHDEIGHVAHGLKWFRQWKDPMASDWDAFRGALRVPLSPQRAKGVEFNAEARRAAGLDPDFIARLDLFARSKGRTPRVFLFNPLAEGFIARGPGFTPAAPARQLARDLACLPQFLARRDDVVIVPEAPAPDFLATLRSAGFEGPEFVVAPEGARLDEALGDRKLGGLRPWAWAPDSQARLAPLFDQVTGDDAGPDGGFHAALAVLYSKAWSARFLEESHAELAQVFPALSPAGVIGRAVADLSGALGAIGEFRARGFHRLVVKQALGLAGANAIRLWE
ncbi:MAG: ferritin-like domain-containing protein, partial [Verrucomicrobium sp.]|nr:ferritin-like domain-containing protein [Verrucomicrobium sp.]